MRKTVRLGTVQIGARAVNVFCRIEFNEGKLSIVGVEGPKQNGDCIGSCGQINMGLRDQVETINPAPGWDTAMLRRFFAVWDEWHLNDLTAGSPAQTAYLKANPVTAVYPENHYDKASKALADAGLNPDPNYMHNGKPYAYGHAWLSREVPADVLEWLQGLPDTDITPAWV